MGERARHQSARQDSGGERSGGSKPRKAATRRARKGSADRTHSRRDRSPEVDRARGPRKGTVGSRGERQEGRDPREGARSARGERLEGRSPWTLGRRKAAAGTVVDAARGVPKPRTWHGAGPEASRTNGSAVPACVVGQESPGKEASSAVGSLGTGRDGAGVLRWTSEGKRKRREGRRPERSGSAGSVSR